MDGLREILAGEFSEQLTEIQDGMLYYEAELRPVLRVLTQDPLVTLDAREFLLLLGDPGDRRFIMQLPPLAGDDSNFKNRWLYWVSATLVNPETEAEWTLLREFAINKFRPSDATAALRYAESHPGSRRDQDLVKLAADVAQVIKIGKWEGNDLPRYNRAGDKALVDFHFHAGLDALTYTATFHRIDDMWELRGVRETRQGFAP